MKSRVSLLMLPALVVGLVAPVFGQSPVAGSRPNIVLMLADDMGWAQPGFNGGDKALTPNIDKLAGEGMRLKEFYVPFNAVHGPLNVPPRHSDYDDVRDAMLKCLDDAVGRVVGAVDKNGFAENTLVIFTNDNGPVLEEMSKPYRGTKNTTFEGGVRSPCVMRWPGKSEPGTTRDGMMFIADFYSTMITLAGGKHEQARPVDALDMTGMLFEAKPSPRSEIIFEVTGSVRLPTIRSGDYKLMGDMLFDIKQDPGEQKDIAASHPDIVKKLAARLEAVAKERPPLGDKPLLMDPPLPYIYGEAENRNPPEWLKKHVEAVRAAQPQEWAPGETPWPQAPVGAHAAKQ
jgi:arylsulfatase A-like enzyme